MDLVQVSSGSGQGASDAIPTTVGTWVYDDAAGTVTLSGTHNNRFDLNPVPNNDLFTHVLTDVIFDLDNVTVTGAAYACEEGQFGASVSSNLCANTGFGDDFTDNSQVDYSSIPGVRTLGTGDISFGAAQQLSDYDAAFANFNGTTLIIETLSWTNNPGGAGLQLQFQLGSGPTLIAVPDLSGLNEAAAIASIESAGLAVGSVTEVIDTVIPRGQVSTQSPLPCNECILPNSAVDVLISLGPEPLVSTLEMLDRLVIDVEALQLTAASDFALNRWLRSTAIILRLCSMDEADLFVPGISGPMATVLANIRQANCAADGVDRAQTRLQLFLQEVDLHVRDIGLTDEASALEASVDEILAALLAAPPTLGVHTLMSGGVERTYYLLLPTNYSRNADALPVLFANHGTGGTFNNWFAGGYYNQGLLDRAGDDAIIVLTQALPNANGVNQWDFEYDFEYFDNLLFDVGQKVVFDAKRVFATGHSSGGSYTNELGCQFGDVIRAIAPSAGGLTGRDCTGSVAILQIQSSEDQIVPPSLVHPGMDFWVLYNGLDKGSYSDGITEPCIDYSSGTSDYPVQWCLHDTLGDSGHLWWAKADDAIWDFFQSLPYVTPTPAAPPGGGNERAQAELSATLTFSLHFAENIGEVYRGAAVLYPHGSRQPIYTAPIWFLNTNIDLGAALPGTEQTYEVPIQLFDPSPEAPLPGSYTLSVSIYVVGGGFPTPATGIDHIALYDIEITDKYSDIVVDEVLTTEPLDSF